MLCIEIKKRRKWERKGEVKEGQKRKGEKFDSVLKPFHSFLHR